MSAVTFSSFQNPPDDAARDMVRRLTARLLQYPQTPNARADVIERAARYFDPSPGPGQPLPVAGVAAATDAYDNHEVAIFTTVKGTRLTGDFLDEFSSVLPGLIIRPYYTGEFKLCGVGGDSLGFGTPSGETGTLGCVVEDSAQDEYALSANHVIALENKATIGVDEAWSPGSADGGTSINRIGVLSNFKSVDLGGVKTNIMDAAIAKLDTRSSTRAILKIGHVKGVSASPAYNSRVQKYGNRTKHTKGDLTFKNMSLLLRFGGGQALFIDQYGLIGDGGSRFADSGDSGSLVVNKAIEAVGLIMAVAGTGEIAVANPIEPILKEFGVSF